MADHHSKRIRLTLPPITAPSIPAHIQPPNGIPPIYQLPLHGPPPPPPPSLRVSVSLPPLSQKVDSLPPVLPAPFTPQIPLPQGIPELPPIDSLGPIHLSPISTQYNSNPMSVSSILSSSEEDSYTTNLPPISQPNLHLDVIDSKHIEIETQLNHHRQIEIVDSLSNHRHRNHIEVLDSDTNHDNEIEGLESQPHHPIEAIDSPKSPVALEESSIPETTISYMNNENEAIYEDNLSIAASISNEFHYDQEFEPRRRKLIVHNDEALNMRGVEEKRLGYIVYNPKEILPPLEFHENGLLEVWISSQHLTWDNSKVRKRWLWGTDVYSDDSDVVAVLIHTGNFIPKLPKSQWISSCPDHDLCVTIRVLPKLVQYTSTMRNRIKSRSWGNHHGVSFKIEGVRKMKEGEAYGRARGGGRKQRLQRFHRLKRLAFGENKDNRIASDQSALLGFNIDGDPCFKYIPQLMANQEKLLRQLRSDVMFLENDEERYEISYDPRSDRYRFAVVLPSIQLGEHIPLTRQDDSYPLIPFLPLEKLNLEETLRDDLTLQDLEWNIVGVIIKDRINTTQSLLIVLKRVFWRKRAHEVISPR
ncbi:hypothetical protein G9A89_011002 [Geosiphon pyriformis]|nr:hypothetical protein G9A89_011002 [Geosiphon pyriformis]